jgi:hypothetical protein
MNYTDAILWYASWPILIYLSYKFVLINLKHHAKMEKLEMYEEKFAKECEFEDKLLKAD